jgi:hypothetical protein
MQRTTPTGFPTLADGCLPTAEKRPSVGTWTTAWQSTGIARQAFQLRSDRSRTRPGMRNASAKNKPMPSSGAAPRSKGSSPATSPQEPRATSLLWWLAVILACWSYGFTTMQGSDLWWHLASGHWIAQTGTFDFTDPFSFTCHGRPWFHPEWLTDLILYAWAKVFGMTFLVWWKWGILVATFGLLFRLLRKISGHSGSAYLAMLAAVAIGAPFFDIRPQLYTFLGFVVILSLALPLSRRLWVLPLVLMLWANLHSGFLLGLFTIMMVLVVSFFYGEVPRRAAIIGLACLLACFVNANGSDALVWPIRFAEDSHSPFLRVAEWLPPYEPGGIRSSLYYPSIAAFVVSAAVVLGLGTYRRQPRLTISALVIGLVTLVMSLKSRRFIPLFGISQSLLLAPALAAGLSWLQLHITRSLPRLDRSRAWLLAPPVVAVIWGGLRLLPYPLSSSAFLYLTSLDSFPVEAMNLVEANHIEGKVFTYYNWGGYVELRTEGRLQVFIDGRAGTVFDAKTYRQYQRVASLHNGWEDVVWDSGADFVLWPRRDPKQIEQLLKSERWHPLYSDHVATLLVREDHPPPRPLLPTPDSPWRDLTLGWSATHVHEYAEAEVHFQRALNRMPNLRPACEWLANAQSQSARLAEAEVTLDRCQRMFPDRGRRKQLLDLFKTRSGGLPP